MYTADSYTRVERRPGCGGEVRLLSTDRHMILPFQVPVRLIVTSADVIHNFNVKSLAVSMDAVPGRCHRQVVSVVSPGLYGGLCSEVCGAGHYRIALRLEAISLGRYVEYFGGA